MSAKISDVKNQDGCRCFLGLAKKTNEALLKLSKVDRDFIAKLNGFQKLLLITDGTVTELLECYLNEPITVEKLTESILTWPSQPPTSHRRFLENHRKFLYREVVLKGKQSFKKCLYAESSILIDNLPENFKNDLVKTEVPIGRLWSKHQLETYKTDFTIQREVANADLAFHLGIGIDSEVLSRTYCVYSDRKRTMVITEKFSINEFY